MESTLREYLKNNYEPKNDGYDDELFYNTVGDYYSSKGMEWTADDVAVIKEYGHNPDDYLDFTAEQLMRLDEIQDAAIEFCRELIRWPEGSVQRQENEEIADDLYTAQIWCQIAEYVSEFLHNNGFSIYFPAHVEVDDEVGTEYITDEWE